MYLNNNKRVQVLLGGNNFIFLRENLSFFILKLPNCDT